MSILPIRNLGNSSGGGTKVPSPLIPAMTSNTYPSGYVASASSEAHNNAYRAFDRTGVLWGGVGSGVVGVGYGWVQIKFPNPVKAKWASITIVWGAGYSQTKGATVEGSNDGATWIPLGSVDLPNENVGEVKFALESNLGNYLYYRFTSKGCYNNDWTGFVECQLYDEEPRTYLYKDGKQNVTWDNSGTYISESGYYSAGGATLNDGNMSFSTPSTSMYNRAIITDSVIDVSQYSTLKVACVYNNAEHVLSVDISSIVSSGYIALSQSNYSGQRFFTIVVATQKNNFSVNHLAQLVTNTNASLVVVNRVWLEK